MIKDDLPQFLTYKEKLPEPDTNKPKRGRFEDICEDIDGKVDEKWRESVKKHVPEILWNPQHPDRAQTTTIKGGKGSGNWGHSGLSGVWGGSSTPTKTKPLTVREGWQPSPIHKAQPNLENLKENPDYKKLETVANQMHDFTGIDSKTGYSVETRLIRGEEIEGWGGKKLGSVIYKGDIKDENYKTIGEVGFSYNANGNIGNINFIWLDKAHRKGGFGRRYIDHVENVFFDKIGVDSVNLIAALDVGGYFWARAGYDFVKPSEKREAIQWLQKEWKYRYESDIPKNITANLNHTWDIATLVGSDGFPIGKQAMLGVTWHGSKKPNSLGWDIGKEYYNID